MAAGLFQQQYTEREWGALLAKGNHLFPSHTELIISEADPDACAQARASAADSEKLLSALVALVNKALKPHGQHLKTIGIKEAKICVHPHENRYCIFSDHPIQITTAFLHVRIALSVLYQKMIDRNIRTFSVQPHQSVTFIDLDVKALLELRKLRAQEEQQTALIELLRGKTPDGYIASLNAPQLEAKSDTTGIRFSGFQGFSIGLNKV